MQPISCMSVIRLGLFSTSVSVLSGGESIPNCNVFLPSIVLLIVWIGVGFPARLLASIDNFSWTFVLALRRLWVVYVFC